MPIRSSDGIAIRLLSPDDSLEELTQLIHRAYKILADMGLRYMGTHQSVDVTRDRVTRGVCLVAEDNGRIIATLTYYPPTTADGSPWLNRADVSLFGQMAVEPEYQKRGIASQLIAKAEQMALVDGAAELALDTAEPATHLIRWYEKMGYRFIEYVQWETTNYRSVVMSKRLRETDRG